MTENFTGAPQLRLELNRIMDALASRAPADHLESQLVDLKEETGRRGPDETTRPGERTNEAAAQFLAGELACLANSGGGAVVLGVADDGTLIGTALDPEWLRYRIYELTDRKLTVAASPAAIDGTRVLELVASPALEPIRFRNRIRHRVGRNCVEIDAATWASGHQLRLGFDWSAQLSGRQFSDIRAGALEAARDFLLGSGESAAADLAAASDHDLVRRLNLCDEQGRLLNAGAILLCSGQAAIDYRRREVAGGDVSYRVHREGRSLLEQLTAVIDAIQLNNRRVELGFHWAHGQVHRIPNPAAREALVNGITHRDWESPVPTEVEHVGDRMSVISPGGFVGGVTPTNIITHPSTPRYPRLAQALTALRIAERQGIGVDRMHREMLALGLPSPVIDEIPGPLVRTVLLGGEPEEVWLRLLTTLEPPSASRDLEFLLVLDLAAHNGWASGDSAASLVQRSRSETGDVLRRLAAVRWPAINQPVFVPVTGDPRVGRDPYEAAWQLHELVRRYLDVMGAGRHRLPDRETLLFDYARQRGRISSTEAASLLATTSNTARGVLEDLVRQGRLAPNRENRRGRGFAYLPTQTAG